MELFWSVVLDQWYKFNLFYVYNTSRTGCGFRKVFFKLLFALLFKRWSRIITLTSCFVLFYKYAIYRNTQNESPQINIKIFFSLFGSFPNSFYLPPFPELDIIMNLVFIQPMFLNFTIHKHTHIHKHNIYYYLRKITCVIYYM